MTSRFQRLIQCVAAFPSVRLLCMGDVMLDRYVYGRVMRVSAEAPVPIIAHQSEAAMLGGIGNVARNVAALGEKVTLVGIVGDDAAGRQITAMLEREPHIEDRLVRVAGRRTTQKTRYVARGQQLLRVDEEDASAPSNQVKQQLLDAFRSALAAADVVLLSDYAKGCLDEAVLAGAIREARERGVPVIADPHRSKDIRSYGGADLIKPNADELGAATGMACDGDDAAVAAGRRALEMAGVGAVLVTRSEQGMTLIARDLPPRHFKETPNEVFDVSGAGDTALAVLGLAVGVGASLEATAELANKACSLVVSKFGTAVVHASELQRALQDADFESVETKVIPLPVVVDSVVRWRNQGMRIGFTNGCFDLIHAGHVSLLAQAKASCDRLVVGLNSDESVWRLKGEGRPINGELARAAVLASLEAVDAVVLFAEDTPLRLIEAIRPDVLVKGADYTEEQVVGAAFVRGYGGQVLLARLTPSASTTGTIEKIKG